MLRGDGVEPRPDRLLQRFGGACRAATQVGLGHGEPRLDAFTGGKPDIAGAQNKLWREEETIHGMNTAEMRKLGEYISRAMSDSLPAA